MRDYLIRATALGGKVRAFAIDTTGVVGVMNERHRMMPTAAAALGRTATAALIMGAMLKGKERLTIQIKGGGPIGTITVEANADGEVRGFVDDPQISLPLNAVGKLDVAGAVGTDGFLSVTKDLGMRDPYHGSTPIVSGEIAEDFTYYFASSEQTPSAVALGVLVDVDYTIRAAGGFIVQLLPGLADEEIAGIEEQLSKLPSVTTMIDQGSTPEQLLLSIFPDVNVLGRMDVRFQCKCSHEKIEQTLISLGKEELKDIKASDGHAEVICHFCSEAYQFTDSELGRLIDQL
jgi:molecular chaperone Hsp33